MEDENELVKKKKKTSGKNFPYGSKGDARSPFFSLDIVMEM